MLLGNQRGLQKQRVGGGGGLFARPVRMPVAEAQKGRGRKATASVSAAAARRQSALSEEEDEASIVQRMDQDDESNRDDPDFDEGEEEEEHIDDEDEDEDPDSNATSEPEEQIEPPSFSLATLGLQRVGSAPPPKPKVQKAPILTLNARGMPARIRKRNKLFYDDNIINDDKPLRMSLAPKKMPGRPPLSAGGGSAQKSPLTPSKVLKKRKGVVSRYMRSNEQGSSPNSASSQSQQVGKHKKTPTKAQSVGKLPSASKLGSGALKSGRGAHLIGKGAAAAAAAAAEEEASQAEATALANKRLGQSIGLRLRNLLKLPKAHKWAIAEWFYSYIDKPLFDCRDEFMNHVNELAPRLNTRSLNRHEWVNIRRRMGRPRRCSANFFSEERKELDRKRQLMRTLQSRKPGEFKDSMLLSDMPEKIPMPLPLGTKVTARLRTPQDGIFAGTVAAYDSMNSMYRVTFERPGLGTHAIPDYEIVSENFHEMLPLHSFTKDFRPNLMSIYQTNNLGFTTNLGFTANLTSNYLQKKEKAAGGGGAGSNYSRPQKHLASNNAAARNALSMKLNKSDPLLGQDSVGESPIRQQLARHHAYSSTLLEHLVHLEKHIAVKADRIQRLNKMNATAELAMGEMISQDENGDRHRRQIADNFQRQYAFNIVSIERINGELMFELTKVQEMSTSLTRNPNVQAMISPTYLREECRAKASQTVDDINKGMVKNPRMIRLLKNLTTLLIVTQNLGGDCDVSEVNKVLEGCLEEVRSNLFCSDNSEVFQKSVQVRLEYIAMDISRSLEEHSRTAENNDDVKSPLKSEEHDDEDDMDENRVQDHEQEPEEAAADTSKTRTKGRPKKVDKKDQAEAGKKVQKDQHMDTDAEEEEKLDSDESDNAEHLNQQQQDDEHDTEEQHLEPEEQSPIPAATEDTQITIESMKESDDEFQSTAETEEEDDMAGLEQLKMEGEEGEEDEDYVYAK
ncbi:protein lin-9 homolog [Drosophila rhopaloa]|uniref:Protein lin-9 homolog n=1 Tax=Drosophila rhopaloa TaxID=1041015 RepID=A0A6P4EZR9_DRORH|nr:protein lin-9 homolog [Drosophila rhopaloa]